MITPGILLRSRASSGPKRETEPRNYGGGLYTNQPAVAQILHQSDNVMKTLQMNDHTTATKPLENVSNTLNTSQSKLCRETP